MVVRELPVSSKKNDDPTVCSCSFFARVSSGSSSAAWGLLMASGPSRLITAFARDPVVLNLKNRAAVHAAATGD